MIATIDFLDKAHIGFLTGDIHPFTINLLEKELIKLNEEKDIDVE